MAKQINTRILLKYDTLENWQKSDFNGTDATKYLKAGELAIVTLGSDVETNHPTNASNQHPLLFKVGDGAHKFDELAWASALAADVYDWAKQSEHDFVTNFLALKTNDNKTMQDKLDAVFATDTELANAIGDLSDSILAMIGELSDLTTAEKDTFVGAINELDAEIGDLSKLDTALESPANLVAAINKTLAAVEAGGTGSVVTVEKATSATAGSKATYVVKQGGEAVEVKIEIPDITKGSANGTISYGGADVEVTGLGTAAYASTSELLNTASGYVTELQDELTNGNITVASADSAAYATEAGNVSQKLIVKLDGAEQKYDGRQEITVDIDTVLEAAITDAKKYADDNDDDTLYHLEYDSANKKIRLVAGEDTGKMEIPTDDFIKDGMIETVELVQQDGEGNKGQFLKLTWNDDGKDVTYISVGALVDVYTAKADATEVQVAISNTNEVSATLVNGGVTTAKIADKAVTEAKLEQNVQTALGLARTALQSHQDINGKADKVSGAVNGNLAALDATGNLADSGKKAADFALAADLGDLAAKDTVGTADIDNNAITTEKLATTVVTAISNGNTAFDWGDHAQAGYAVAENLNIVAYSGQYGDLINRPTLGALAAKDKITSDDFSTEVFVFNCGSASTVL